MTIKQSLENCELALRDTARNLPNDMPHLDRKSTMRATFRAHLPMPVNRSGCLGLIACVAKGVSLGIVDGNEAKTLLYAAQLALSSFPKRASRKGGKAKA
jgi:hypothetical protein